MGGIHMNNMVSWFEIPVKDLERAKTFYSKVFGKELTDMKMGDMVMSSFPWQDGAPFSGGALVKSKGYVPSSSGTVVYFYCEDAAVEQSRVEKNGGKVVLPKTAIGDSGFIAHIIDTEGNRVGLHSWK
jgi:predicted enzyme related to lactoylglutathione lyase